MTDTRTQPVEDIAETHDFDPECEVDVLIVRQGINTGIRKDQCRSTAAWVGVAPCGHDSYFCAQHHYDQRSFTCHQCGTMNMHLATYKWIRL